MGGSGALAAIATCALAAAGSRRSSSSSSSAIPERWKDFESWQKDMGVSYKSEAHALAHYPAWVENDDTIRAHNAEADMHGYELGHSVWSAHTWNQFQEAVSLRRRGADLEERKSRRSFQSVGLHRAGDFKGHTRVGTSEGGGKGGESRHRSTSTARMAMDLGNRNSNVPAEVDWVTAGAVSPIQDQDKCGSCWAFSAAGAIEGAYFVESGDLIPLSVQELVSCDYGPDAGHFADAACRGGLPDNAFGWTGAVAGGLCSGEDYPYVSGDGQYYECQAAKCTARVTITGFVDVKSRDELALMDAVAQQPVSVAVEASEYIFMLYKAGVMDSLRCGRKLDHAVLAVGYGTDPATGKLYWKIKNSWGTSWGEDGYMRLRRGRNMCGIALLPSYPTGAQLVPAPVSTALNLSTPCNAPVEGDVKMTAYPSGTLLLFTRGEWHTMCADTSSAEMAGVACASLGYASASLLTNKPGPGHWPMAPGRICAGTEAGVGLCGVVPIEPGDMCAESPSTMAAYVRCFGVQKGRGQVSAAASKCGTSGWGGHSIRDMLQAIGDAPGAPAPAQERHYKRHPARYTVITLFVLVGVLIFATLCGPLTSHGGGAPEAGRRLKPAAAAFADTVPPVRGMAGAPVGVSDAAREAGDASVNTAAPGWTGSQLGVLPPAAGSEGINAVTDAQGRPLRLPLPR
mmetsp:Transcript_7246/g.21119  ORF Transcript_7246/g.21119 Transcript_7246/m.21119 type:complete len:684 (-) Transcript_7246:26-2077(-)